MRPTGAPLTTTPLFPTDSRPRPAFLALRLTDYGGLGKLVRRVISWAFRCRESSPTPTPYTAYSLRIGGAVALRGAGADGRLVIAAMGQWRSDVYQIYIRTARHKAMTWTVRMSRGLQTGEVVASRLRRLVSLSANGYYSS
jgi:hypothetical protein